MSNDDAAKPGFETRMIHAGSQPEPITGARQTPIFQNTSYVFHDADHAASLFNLQTFGFIYSRLTNPTVSVLEERIASLEGGRGATCCASGHAAQILTFFAFMEPGDSFIASNRLYGGSITQFGKTFKKFGWNAVFVDVDDPENVRQAMTPDVKAIFVESLANPGGVISDLETLSSIAHDAGIPLIVDNTMATPYLCRPIEWGADLVVHSTTKFLSGHGTAVGGAVVDSGRFDWSISEKFKGLNAPEPAYHGLSFYETFGDMAFTMQAHAVGLRDLGPTMAPMNAFLTLLGSETLSLRMERHCENALKIARFLDGHDAVAWVNYAGLPDNRYHALAGKYLPKGAGSVFTFGLKGGYEAGLRLVEEVNLFSHLANIGDTRSLILHPASTTHRQLTDEQRTAAGAGNDVIRLSIGLETADDLIEDLNRALKAAGEGRNAAE
jgi:O-acetylhomoserine (thiol)-lyase